VVIDEEPEEPLEEDEDKDEEEEPEPEEVDTAPVPRVRPVNTSGKKQWGARSRFSKGSAMRVENKAFIQN
jgi:hypothetical protein